MALLKRTTHQPQEFTPKQMEGFSLLSHKASAIAITNRLSGSQFRLWHYLLMIDSFADRSKDGERIYHDIPSPVDIGLAIGVHRKTVEKDMRRLEELGLYARQITSWQGYNLSAEDARIASAAMKQAKAARITAQPLKSLRSKGCYLTPSGSYLTPTESCLTPTESYLAPAENVETVIPEALQPIEAPDQTIQTNLDSTDNLPVDEKIAGKEENIEATQGLEPTGILEEPETDPIAQIQQATVQLQDEREIFNSLRLLGIETNDTVRGTMKKHAANIPSAIAHIKQRYDSREKFGNITGAFVKACKEDAKPKLSLASWGLHAEVNPPTEEQLAALDKAKSRGAIADYFLSSDNIRKIVLPNGFTQMPWWEWLLKGSVSNDSGTEK